MAVPDYQTLMLPLLLALQDKQPKLMRDLFEELSDQFELSEEERNERVPSGRETKIKNRISWARTYLKKAGLLDSPKKGEIQITAEGIALLTKDRPNKINNVFLRNYKGFREFRPRSTNEQVELESPVIETTPEEQLGTAYSELEKSLNSDLLEHIDKISPRFFEDLVVDLMLAIGYGGDFKDAGFTTPQGPDNGIDGIIFEDKLGLDKIYLQAKKWTEKIGRPEIDTFIGALYRHGAAKGVLITTSSFTEHAQNAIDEVPISIVLIDGKRLAELMVEHDVGVAVKRTITIKQVDFDYFEEN